MKSTVLAIAALFMLACNPAMALDLTVAPDGSDSWSGRLVKPNAKRTDGPLASLDGARNTIREFKASGGLKEPVNVFVRGGTYFLSRPFVLEPQDSGTDGCPVTYAAAPGEKPVFSGGRVIRGWRQHSKGLWVTEIPGAKGGAWQFRQLFVNGRRATLARSPNEGYYRVVGKAAPLIDTATGKQRDFSKQAFRFKPGDLKNWTDLRSANLTVFFHWETGMLRIKSVDETTNTVTFTGELKWPFWGRQRYYLENAFEALDAPGEWYLNADEGRLYYWPRVGEDMPRSVVIAPALTQLVRFAGDAERGLHVENLRFQGLSFQHCDYVLEPEGHSDGQAAVTVPAAVDAVVARHCAIDRCEFAHLGGYAVAFRVGCNNNRIAENHFHDLGAGGVKLGEPRIPQTESLETSGNEVSSNFIHDSGIVYYGAIGVWIGQSSDNVIAHNEICDQNYTAISCGWTWGFGPTKAHRNRIEHNYLHDIGRGRLCDMGAIYTLGTSPGTVIRGNLIHDIWDWEEGYGAGGIYPDAGSSQILIENNVVYRTASGGLTVHYGRDNIARNNIFAFGRDGQIHLGRRDQKSSLKLERNIVYYDEGNLMLRDSDLDADNNVYWNTKGTPVAFPTGLNLQQWQAKGLDVHSLIADPMFVNAARYDFRLKSESPALQLGFKPIDIKQAGLTGPPELIKMARSIKRPRAAIPRRTQAPPLPLDDGFELTPVGATADSAYTHGETAQATIRVTDEVAAIGKRSLRFTDAPGLDQPWNPHIFYSPHFTEGTVEGSFDLRIEQGAQVWVEWRDASSPYRVGPSMGIDGKGTLKVRDQQLLTLPPGQWIHFDILCGLGKQAIGTWQLSVTISGQEPKRYEALVCDPACKELQWFGFVSNATEQAVFSVDNVKLHAVKHQ
ncbi:MAG: hypothetical protein GW893_00595 [Armatimonadetes bacterium]|nr:hypothetical protein [Armatimonadota bacterium]PIU66628.1 MAG: hypothetical protein COS85_04060 [Armatimonadetes bacterium CG07_land_8_20_14_0_80_59_28]PIX40065.1 MAG: hypothetical protein COZ56_15615 [Armatimonadetes bacterium CG_4_8_14_3_um_filter_58_9]PJB64038.1 MAG: hypothetical protein CO095_15315 [Armatimonadetes bacterium CG_4_9_14_3_um_filter_58_7]